MNHDILIQNKASWNAIADSFFGVTALPVYGCLCPVIYNAKTGTNLMLNRRASFEKL